MSVSEQHLADPAPEEGGAPRGAPPSGEWPEFLAAFSGRFTATSEYFNCPSFVAFVAHDSETDAECIVKAFPTGGMPPGVRLRLDRDLPILKRLDNDCLPRLIEWAATPDWRFTVFLRSAMETLEDRVAQRPLSIDEMLQTADRVLQGLAALHDQRTLHNNVDLGNVALPAGNCQRAVLVGLGPARAALMAECTDADALRLSYFVSPEQAGSIEHDVGPWSDLYSLGATLFAALTGRPPFLGDDMGQVLYEHMTAPPPTLASRGVEAPRAVEEFLQHLLKKDPATRYQTAAAALADVRAIAASLRRGDDDPKVVIGATDLRCTIGEPAYVGRDRELRQFVEAIAETKSGRGGLVLVEAISGGGKSRFLTEVAQLARRQEAWVIRGDEVNEVGRRTLQLLDGLVAELLARADAQPAFAARMRTALEDHRHALAAILPRLQPLVESRAHRKEPEQFGEARALRAVAALLDALGVAGQPVVVLLDDCQWADEFSQKMLRHWTVGESTKPGSRYVSIVAAFRSEEVAADHPLRQLPAQRQVALPPLTDDELRQLAESMAGALPADVLDVVVKAADGSPFMASAVLRGLFECGTLRASRYGWQVDSEALRDCQSSEAVGALLTERVALLSPEAIELLSIGAVLGKEFDLDLAAHLASTSTSQLIESLDEARQKRLVWLRPDSTSCVFVHDKIRAAVLDYLSEDRTREVHRRAAELFSDVPDGAAEAAYHFDAAGNSTAALPYALTAAASARARYALEIAKQQYRIAQRGLASADQSTRFAVLEGIGDVELLQGRYDSAAQALHQAARLAEGSEAHAEVCGKLAELAMKRGDMEQAATEFEAALRVLGAYIPRSFTATVVLLAYESVAQLLHTVAPRLFLHRRRRAPDPRMSLKLRLFNGLAHSYWYARSRADMFWAHLACLNTAELYQPSEELAEAYASHGVGMSLYGLFGRAEDYCRRSLEIRSKLGNAWGQGQSLHYWGMVLYAASRFRSCIEKCRESVRLLERVGDYQQMHLARYQIAASHYHLGDFSAAIETAKRNRNSGLLTGDAQAAGINLEVWARADHDAIPIDAIREERSRERLDPQGVAQVELAYAVWLTKQQQNREAVSVLRQAIGSSYARGVRNPYTLPLLTWVVTALRSEAKRCSPYAPRRRRRVLREARRAARRAIRAAWVCKNDLPRALRESALIDSMRGRQRQARRKLLRSLVLARRQRARYEFALSLIAYGKIGQEAGWNDAEKRRRTGLRLQEQLELPLHEKNQSSGSPEETASLSLIDRFDTVLSSGRRIASALQEQSIYDQTRCAALRLLRGQRCIIWAVQTQGGADQWQQLTGDPAADAEQQLAARCLETFRRRGASPLDVAAELPDEVIAGSHLAAPVLVRGEIRGVLMVSHGELTGLFGDDELRLAAFVSTIAGAALENAAGFRELQELNLTLEERVAERTAAAESKARELAESYDELKRVADELKVKEEQLRVAKIAAEAASSAKSQFLATMSHEIRTPMNGILGMAELALRSSLTPQLQTYIETIKQSGQSLLMLLNDVLDLSKIEAGKMELEDIDFDLRQVVGDAVKLMSAAAANKGLELFCDVAARTPPTVLGDPSRLRQIIVNLVGNAIKFTDEGEVKTSVQLVPKLRGAVLRFAVTDTGPGIPEDKQQHVFGAFQQSDGSTTRKYGGTGLGLSISSELVELMGGTIWLESEVGVGSSFLFEIPLRTPDGQLSMKPADESLADAAAVAFSANASGLALYAGALESAGANVAACDACDELATISGEHGDSQTRLAVIDLACDETLRRQTIATWQPLADAHGWKTIWLAPIDWLSDEAAELAGTILTKPILGEQLAAAARRLLCSIEDETAGDAAEASKQAARKLRILLVDDSPINQQVGAGLLATLGHEVVTADDGAQAVDAVRRQPFDIVLMDLEMPVMDGFEATRTMRADKDPVIAQLPIVAMTAHAVGAVQHKCADAGMCACLTKPFKPEELFAKLDELTAQAAAAADASTAEVG
ncbi:MAG: hypothetical protein CMJ58_13290 [Planctomycetaceae bacterium]|nr:hypothetical protein [Planctomycetaceae bacterium]